MMLNGWRLPLRLAFRDMRRYKGRSMLASLLIFLPVLVMGAALTGISTFQISDTDRVKMTMAHATSQITLPDTAAKTAKPLPGMTHAADQTHIPTPAQFNAAGAEGSAVLIQSQVLATQDKSTYSGTYGGISGDPQVSSGWFKMTSGHAPQNGSEVVVTTLGKHNGFPTSGSLIFTGADHKKHVAKIVGVAATTEPLNFIGEIVFPQPLEVTALVKEKSSPPSDTWSQYGLRAQSTSDLLPSSYGASDKQLFLTSVVTALLVTTLALLAGPAFAAGATRSRRSLALLNVNGGRRNVLRRVVLAQALLLGSLAAAAGITIGGVIGVVLAKNAHLIWPDQVSGPTEIPWGYGIGIWFVSTVASLIAAFIPAIAAGRTSVLGALRGQVSPRKVRKHLPVLGLAFLFTGLLLCYRAGQGIIQRHPTTRANIIFGIPLYFAGAILLVPGLLLGIGHLAKYLPVTARIAIRDVSRQRTRATAAVGVVLVTAALLSTALVAGLSYDTYLKKQYVPSGPEGAITVDATQFGNGLTPSIFTTYARESVPGATITSLKQFESKDAGKNLKITNIYWNAKSCSIHDLLYSSGGARSAQDRGATVYDTPSPAGFGHLTAHQKQVLNDGGVLVVLTRESRTLRAGQKADGLTAEDISSGRITATTARISGIDQGSNSVEKLFGASHADCTSKTLAAATVYSDQLDGLAGTSTGNVIMLTRTAQALGGTPSTAQVMISRTRAISHTEAATLLQRITSNGQGWYSIGVEHGYSSPVKIFAGVLTALAAMVVLMTTIIATLLSQAEGKADASTLAATGASRGMARRVACTQAIAVGLVGGVIGSVVGFGPGALLAYVNTSHSSDQYIYSPIIEIPWQYLGIVILVVPLVAGLVIALTVPRSPEITRRTV